MHVGETAVETIVPPGELRVIDAEQVHHGGVDVVAGRGIRAVERAPDVVSHRDAWR